MVGTVISFCGMVTMQQCGSLKNSSNRLRGEGDTIVSWSTTCEKMVGFVLNYEKLILRLDRVKKVPKSTSFGTVKEAYWE